MRLEDDGCNRKKRLDYYRKHKKEIDERKRTPEETEEMIDFYEKLWGIKK